MTRQDIACGQRDPPAGTTYDLVTANKLTGNFNVLDLPDLGGDRSWHVTYGADRFSVTVVPESASGLLAAIGLAIVLGMRRWRCHSLPAEPRGRELPSPSARHRQRRCPNNRRPIEFRPAGDYGFAEAQRALRARVATSNQESY